MNMVLFKFIEKDKCMCYSSNVSDLMLWSRPLVYFQSELFT